MALLNGCCCCFSLRTGTLILLWLSAIGGVLATLAYGATLTQVNVLFDLEFPENVFATLILIGYFLLSIACFVTAVIGINGMKKNTPRSLTPFLYYMGSGILFFILFILVGLFYPRMFTIFLTKSAEYPVTAGQAVFTLLFTTAFQTYFLLVIKSYQDTMVENAARNNVIMGA